MPPNLPAIIALVRRRWAREQRRRSASAQVSVQVQTLAPGSLPPRRTTVKVSEHSVPDFRTRAPQAALRITQQPQLLLPWYFDDKVIDKLEEASVDKGRRLYCLDMRRDNADQVLAALSFHMDADQKRPVQLIALAIRLDGPDVLAQSYAAAWYLLQYVCVAGEKLGRGGELQFATKDAAAALKDFAPLGFVELTPSPFDWPEKALRLNC